MDLAAKEFAKYSGFRLADPITTESRLVILTGVAGGGGSSFWVLYSSHAVVLSESFPR